MMYSHATPSQHSIFFRQAAQALKQNNPTQARHILNACDRNYLKQSAEARVHYETLYTACQTQINSALMAQDYLKMTQSNPSNALDLLEHCRLNAMDRDTLKTYHTQHQHALIEINQMKLTQAREHLKQQEPQAALNLLNTCQPKLMSPDLLQSFYHDKATSLEKLGYYLKAIQLLTSNPTWMEQKTTMIKVAQLHEAQATLMPPNTLEYTNQLTRALEVYSALPGWDTEPQILQRLASIHYRLRHYKTALEYIQAIPQTGDTSIDQMVRNDIRILQAYFWILNTPTQAMQQAHFTLLTHALYLKNQGCVHNALDFYHVIPDRFKREEDRANQEFCKQQLAYTQASIIPFSTFRPAAEQTNPAQQNHTSVAVQGMP